MASKQVLNLASDHFADLAAATKHEMRQMQSTPIGTEPRSGQSQAALWRKLRLLPPPEFDAVMNAAATKAGHQNTETEPCDVCDFVATQAGREAKRNA